MKATNLIAALTAAAAFALVWTPSHAQSTNSQTFDNWTNSTAQHYNGRIPRDAYLDEMGRRWDADPNHQGMRSVYLEDLRHRWDQADANNQGLTPAEVSRLTGKVDSTTSSVPRTGSGAQPGNMGPANSKGQ